MKEFAIVLQLTLIWIGSRWRVVVNKELRTLNPGLFIPGQISCEYRKRKRNWDHTSFELLIVSDTVSCSFNYSCTGSLGDHSPSMDTLIPYLNRAGWHLPTSSAFAKRRGNDQRESPPCVAAWEERNWYQEALEAKVKLSIKTFN